MSEQEVQETKEEIKESKEEDFNVISFFDIKDGDKEAEVIPKVESKLGITVQSLREALSKWTMEHAEELTLDLANIAPHGDYGKLIEDNDGMANFLKSEGHKQENWKLSFMDEESSNKALLLFRFENKAVDDGETLRGVVLVSKAGIVRHAFVVADS